MESEKKFYLESSDRFQMYDLVELAGPKHLRNIPNFLYYYTGAYFSQCVRKQMDYYESLAKTQTPLLPLESLESPAKITPNYVVPKKFL